MRVLRVCECTCLLARVHIIMYVYTKENSFYLEIHGLKCVCVCVCVCVLPYVSHKRRKGQIKKRKEQ